MEKYPIKTVIGIISYNDEHYLRKTLPDINEINDSKIVILDNANNNEIKEFIEKEYPEIIFIRHGEGNIGFSKGHNYILEKSPSSKYYFCLNSDILIDTDTVDACISYLNKHNDVCMVSAKLHHWDFQEDETTDIIDTLGIVGSRGHHFWDRGQGRKDKGQYDNSINDIFGISGAAFLIKRSCINKLHGSPNKMFDENIFMYKDDVDLAYRMRWLGMKIQFLPDILGYHARTLSKKKKKSFFEAQMSYRNHLIMLRNNFSKKYSLNTKFLTFVNEFLKFFYYLFTKPKVIKEFFKVYKMKPDISSREISAKKMEKYLLK